jgi:MFS family permease
VALPKSLAPLRHRPFALLWIGAFVSNIGTWMEAVGIQVLVTETTRSAAWNAVAAAAAFVPSTILSPVGGALADRLPRKVLLITTTAFQTLFAGTLALLATLGSPAPGVVTLIALGAGCVQALGFPAYQSLLPDLVPTEDLVGAVALSSAQWNLGRVVGPALAGIVIGLGGYSWAFWVNTASFFAVIVAIGSLTLPLPVPHDGSSIVASIRAGIRYVRREPGLRVVVALMAINSFLAAPFIGLVATMGTIVFHGGSDATSTLVTAQGVGAVLMALSLGPLAARFGNKQVLVGVLWSLPAALAVYAIMPTLALSAVAIFVVGFLYLGALSSFTSTAQLRAPAAVRGRVMSVLMMLLGGLYPLGTLVQGAIADEIGLRTVTVASGVLMALSLLALRLVRPRFAEALDTGAAPLEPLPDEVAPA